MNHTITEEVAKRVIEVVDAGLTSGVGIRVPGKMCVEAAVCYALGLAHGDDPGCVAPALRALKIRLNDASWSSNQARARGLRRLAVAQLGSTDVLDETEFVRRIADHAIRVSTPKALRMAAMLIEEKDLAALIAAARRCEVEGSIAAANAAADAANAADAVAYAAYAAYAAGAAAAAANAAAAAYADVGGAAASAARDKSLSEYAEAVVQILIEMKAPGCEWLA